MSEATVVPPTQPPGHEAEVDFGDVTVSLAGELVTCYLFSFQLTELPGGNAVAA
ncbi:hypothetical protein OG612_00720 [Streptomyces sp. NBC_01527]|uniref:hypothetical protein n=1 Tax=unclassified Streptomyces TaxID=2593676 RepID=UPI002E149D6A|nr:hypothetical protein OG763_01040 [Streptomyces sp. NBC_01230]